MSSSQIQNSGLKLDSNTDNNFAERDHVRVILSVTPDVNPFAGGTAPTGPVMSLTKLPNDMVHLSWSGLTGTAGANTKLEWTADIPAAFRPQKTRQGIVSVKDNGAFAAGLITINIDGDVIFSTAADAAFTAANACGAVDGGFTYHLGQY